jgi:hypothetical protein
MKKIKYQLVLVAFVVSVLVTACSSGSRMSGGGSSKKCGCGLNKGFVGY